ncbi:Ca2+-binding EF-hand superfamily protein [Caulobacter rhizosphaerae]|jgi:Ca2+-binding EF-hand superfamily protein|uniref:Ca2+-binding EF-hand superfamily protein n=1 Tax=Caulobacter rhizosphaerae TaxID=2010972 RepID=A0ABU1N5T9_9CAUL|nr:EF-hand domain-containing protein [Caulobacter rhizosphaerae]MDR6533794.1 Ca2+-binding EF-hand superfamily protein [Caulobacter rhizosphaerae]
MKILILSACLIMMAASTAQAAARTPGAGLDKADANHDGYVTRDEFKALRAAQFARLDRNDDGVVSLSEFPRLAKSTRSKAQALKAVITHADRDGDGRVARAEFVDGPAPLFDRADRDHDGRLSREEVAALRDQLESLK